MSIENCLSVASELSPNMVLDHLVRLSSGELKIQQDTPGRIYAIELDAYRLDALDVDAEDQATMSSWLDILPSVELIFTLDKRKDIEGIHSEILDLTLKFAKEFGWDFALLLSCDEPVLIRKSGSLLLQENHEFWTSERLKTISAPYTFKELKNMAGG